ncbi:MAG: hypothetical protein E4G93_03185 [Dehalococcoidia bacterium]|nr:MAG: hypothetical protein E4G93_03185 [Dehalococcoidia bacterium]
MESLVMILYLLAAVAGLMSLEMRQARASVAAIGAAFGFVAVAMFVSGAAEVGVGVIAGGAVLVVVLNWGFKRTVQQDALPAFPAGAAGILAIVSLIAFAAMLFVAARQFSGGALPGGAEAHGTKVGLLREAVVVIAALAAVWAMLRKSGRRDE